MSGVKVQLLPTFVWCVSSFFSVSSGDGGCCFISSKKGCVVWLGVGWGDREVESSWSALLEAASIDLSLLLPRGEAILTAGTTLEVATQHTWGMKQPNWSYQMHRMSCLMTAPLSACVSIRWLDDWALQKPWIGRWISKGGLESATNGREHQLFQSVKMVNIYQVWHQLD